MGDDRRPPWLADGFILGPTRTWPSFDALMKHVDCGVRAALRDLHIRRTARGKFRRRTLAALYGRNDG